MTLQTNLFPIVDEISKLLFREHYQPAMAMQLYYLLTDTEAPQAEKTNKFTDAIIELLENLNFAYVNDFSLDTYDVSSISIFFLDEAIEFDEGICEDEELDTLYLTLDDQFKKYNQKVLLIHTSGCELIFLPLPIASAIKLQRICLHFDYFKISDYIYDTSIVFRDPFEVLPIICDKQVPETPIVFKSRKISFDLFFQILDSPLLNGTSHFSTWNTLEESVEILKDKGQNKNFIEKILNKRNKHTYSIFIKNKNQELSLVWSSKKPDELLVFYTSQIPQLLEQPYFLQRHTPENNIISDKHPMYQLWERTLEGIENFEFYKPQINYKQLWQLVNSPKFSETDYETVFKHPTKPITYQIRHIRHANPKKEIYPMLAIQVGSDFFYYRSYEKGYHAFFSPENGEYELILTLQNKRYFWAVILFTEIYNLINSNSL
ncbi:hypothetical protein [Marixanthomonas spongiae]|uniref:Uncharacterized protein n=1 Tax=Marixanthomonas spongiae TaxID=2174845 RepID=A0A2U0HSI6_9FLAO|nr:hypothetical protein [Marixanthomonas spongiae]PVW11720.1 hypothetical protein DDV96_15595 [Marixanthomonas spongiae]